jgi:hypothetical protein
MLERLDTFARHLAQEKSNLIVWRCNIHHKKAAVNDAVREMPAVRHMKTFFDKLYAVYGATCQNKTELESAALKLSI